MKKNQTPNPLHAVFDAMPEEEKIEHIRAHPALVDSCVELFEKRTGYRVQLIPEGLWADDLRYTGRIRCVKRGFSVDRALPFEYQMARINNGLNALQLSYEHWELRSALHDILKLHGVTDARNA